MKTIILTFVAMTALCSAASEPVVSVGSLTKAEEAINGRLTSNVNDPYDMLGPARGTYIEGHGAVFTFEINLIGSTLVGSPFMPNVTPQQQQQVHDRKAAKVEGLKEVMRGAASQASQILTGLPPEENVVIEAFLFSFKWENTRGLPRRIVLTAQKSRLAEAVSRKASTADIAALFTVQEL